LTEKDIGTNSKQSLAYEVAPFNIKMTIVQPNLEIGVLSNKIVSVPPLPQYSPDSNPAPLSREIFSGLLQKMAVSTASSDSEAYADILSSARISSVYPDLPGQLRSQLVTETVFAIAAVGGHDNPPARHIVGLEGVASVKEKLKTVSEELEDFIDVSSQVDFVRSEQRELQMETASD
jgi:hypothetical protein